MNYIDFINSKRPFDHKIINDVKRSFIHPDPDTQVISRLCSGSTFYRIVSPMYRLNSPVSPILSRLSTQQQVSVPVFYKLMEHLRSPSAGNSALQIRKIAAGCHATLRGIITLELCVAIKDRCKLFTRNRIIRTKFLPSKSPHNAVLLCPGYRIVKPLRCRDRTQHP